MASPEGKEARVRKPYKKPRQVTIRETQDGDSEGPTQLGVGETVDNTKPSFVHRKDNSEWGKTMYGPMLLLLCMVPIAHL